MHPRTFKNFQTGDHIRTKKGEIFEVAERETYYCKNCSCNLNVCENFKERTTLLIKSQRGTWEMSLKQLNEKYLSQEIDEATFKQGQWK
jgi:hypothetical protein